MQTRSITTIRNVMIGFVIAIGSLLLLEGFARSVLTVHHDVSSLGPDWYTYSSEMGWERRPNFKGYLARELRGHDPARYVREFDSQGFFAVDTEQVRATDHKRILAIGDSNTFGWGVPTGNSFTEVLDRMLPDASVINLGTNGYTSFQGYATLVRYFDTVRPDLVIASFNFNDRRIVASENAVDSQEKFSRDALLHRVDLIRTNSYLYRALETVMFKAGLVRHGNEGGASLDVRTARTRVSPDHYRQNLERIARFCEERRVPLVFVVLQDNPAHVEHVRAGISYLETGQYELAEAQLRIAVNMDNWFSDLGRKYLALALEKQGAVEEAKTVATINLQDWNSTHGGRPIRLDSEYNDIMRTVARAHGVTVVEAGHRLAQDPSLYLDMCHPDERGHRFIATLLKLTLNGMLHAPAPAVAVAPESDRKGS